MLTFEPITAELHGNWTLTVPAYRAKVPGGWIVMIVHSVGFGGSGSPFFYPDPDHQWDGSSLPGGR